VSGRPGRIEQSRIALAIVAAQERWRMFRSLCRQGSFLILFPVGVAYAIGPGDSRSTNSFVESRNQIIRWASNFVAKKRESVSARPKAASGEIYRGDERLIFGKTARSEGCALHLGRRLESGEWVFNLYLENEKRPADSGSMFHEDPGFDDGAMQFEGRLVLQGQPTVSNKGAVTSLDLHTTVSSMSLLSLGVYPKGILEEDSLSIVLDDESNIKQATYRFTNSMKIRDGRKADPVTCHFDHVF
jgi:hypothetical protein